ncbi:MAG: hypothetical protein AMJ41_03590 [candidate division Zixibacteria bacterium DG_27]|nr:MAG: hypothetical protein AMJ41_03590 [candidate division Zixibacteria bacterium DG_27]
MIHSRRNSKAALLVPIYDKKLSSFVKLFRGKTLHALGSPERFSPSSHHQEPARQSSWLASGSGL